MRSRIVLLLIFGILTSALGTVHGQVQELVPVSHVGGTARVIDVTGETALLGVGANLVIIDISDPMNPTEMTRLHMGGLVFGIATEGRYAYVAADRAGMHIVDIADPTAPEIVSTFANRSARNVFVTGGLAFVVDQASLNEGLSVVDVQNVRAPVELAFVSDIMFNIDSVYVRGDTAYVAQANEGLLLVDISDPTAPVKGPFIETETINTADPVGVVVDGNYAYITDTKNGDLSIIDVSDPMSPTLESVASDPINGRVISASRLDFDNGLVYMTMDERGVRIIDVNDPANPAEIGLINVPFEAKDVAVEDGYAYVVDAREGLRIADVSDPTGPFPIGGDRRGNNAHFVSGTTLYTTGNNPRLRISDFSEPAMPVEIGELAISGSGTIAQDILVDGTVAYIADGGLGLRVVDVSVPASPAELTLFATSDSALGLDLDGSLMYIADDDSGLLVVNVSTPASPSLVGSLDTPGNARAVAVDSSIAYVADGASGLRIIDVSTPAAPSELGAATTAVDAHDVAISGSTAYIADAGTGLRVIDVSNPAAPVEIATRSGLDTSAVEVVGNRVYVSEGIQLSGLEVGALRAYDVSNPANPVELFNVDPGGRVRDLQIVGNLAYTGGPDGVAVFDISDESPPSEISALPVSSLFDLQAVALSGNFAYVANGINGLNVFDLSDPQQPEEVGFTGTPEEGADVVVRGEIAYVGDFRNGVRLIDIADPTAPSELSLAFTGTVRKVDISGPYVFGTRNSASFRIWDASVPSSPTSLAIPSTTSTPMDIVVRSGLAYVTEGSSGLRIYDVGDPGAPFEVGSYIPPGTSAGLDVRGSLVYLSTSSGGFRVVDVSNPATPVEIGFTTVGNTTASDVVVQGPFAYLTRSNLNGAVHVIDIRNPTAPTPVAELGRHNGFTSVAVGAFAYVTSATDGMTVIAIPPQSPTLDPVPPFIDNNTVTVSGTVLAPGSFVTVGGADEPQYQQLEDGETNFSIDIVLRQESVNTLSVTTMNAYGLVSLPVIATVVEGDGFPTTVETVTDLTVTPDPAPAVALNGTLAFTAEATFSDASTADVSEFVAWEDLAGRDVVTEAGLYVNARTGIARIRAFVAGVFSNVVTVQDN